MNRLMEAWLPGPLVAAATARVPDSFWWVVGSIAVLLTVATGIGMVLSRYLPGPVVHNLTARIRSWWVMVVALVACFMLGQTVTLVLFALLSFFALREFISLTPTRRGDHVALCLCFYVAIPLQYGLIGAGWDALFSIAIPVYAFVLLPAVSVLSGDTTDFLARTAKVQWGLMLTVYCLSHAPALMFLQIPGYEGQSMMLLLYLLLVVQLSDVLQYVFGKLFGKRRLAPLVSPGKTVEGLLGGGLCAVMAGTALWWVTPFTPWQAGLLSLLIVCCGALGGLALSAVKRSLDAKDWGEMIEGHGGMLDRLDSVVFTAPVFFHAVRHTYA